MSGTSSRRVRVKICGVTSPEDATLCAAAGADAIGMVLWGGSPRAITKAEAERIVAALPPFVTRVGVFVNEAVDQVDRLTRELCLDRVQLSGDESRAYCRELARLVGRSRIIKTFRVAASFVPETAFAGFDVQGHHLDADAGPAYGGTGRAVSWRLAAGATRVSSSLILAGGLTPGNVATAIATVHPFAVDVASGVERDPGIKEPELVRAFVGAVLGTARG